LTTLADLPPLLREDPVVSRLLGRRGATLAVSEAARAFTLAGLAHVSSRRPLVVAVPTSTAAEHLARDLGTWLGDPVDAPAGRLPAVELFPAWETLPFERVSPGVETMGRRLRTRWRVAHPDPAERPAVVVVAVRALVQRLAPDVVGVEPLTLRPGEQRDRDELVATLVGAGYRREEQVEHRGEVAVRGSIVDVFPSTADRPARVDLWGDEIDRLTEFSVGDQRATDALDEALVFPARELLPTDATRARASRLVATEPWGREQWERLAEGMHFDGMESWLPWLVADERLLTDLLPDEAQLVVLEPRRCRDRAADIAAEEADLARTLSRTWGATDHHDGGWPLLHLPFERVLEHTDVPVLTVVPVPEGPDHPAIAAVPWEPVGGDGDRLVGQLRRLAADGTRVVVAADTEGSAPRLRTLLADRGLGPEVAVGAIERGAILPAIGLAVLAEGDLTGRRRTHRAPRARRRDAERFFDDLSVGDHVVHVQHGVARFGGMVKRAIGGIERDYLLLEYRGDDKLYVPSDQIDTVRHYTGGDQPSLSRLGSGDWTKTKSRVRAAVQEIAQELVVLYQARVSAPGHAFAPDTPWQRELEDAFPFAETPDQLRAIEDVKADMEADRPMDRLVCGDVGFGKTEVAIRAVFKAVQDGKQAAVLVPTTLLAQQHFQTFADRYAAYPVRVEVLSRFLTPGQARAVVKGLASGEVDVVIATHKLLADDIAFKDLGLLVVDEEQRFGVNHKERIKQFKANVDVLTMTATPIPRTLEMSLTGIRDLTLLNTPPAERQPILTYVGEQDERAEAEAIRRELLREGQVFFVHNRVQDIEAAAARVRELVPEARVAVAHGQMDEGTLEQVVLDFWGGEYDVLVCTTIIESGIDMPTVNTLVVDRADRLGLGQLHQLRGRVGRAGMRAYAYLFYPPEKSLSEEAYERLKTIGETTELGSGFKIAMRDLEIRGAGNLLGQTQSGHISAVGYDLYCQMVNEAVAELKGEPVPVPAEIKLDLPVAAHLPPEYVPREDLRLEAYRRLAAVTTDADVADIRAEWLDRYGPVPTAADTLLEVALLRAEASRLGIREVHVAKGPGAGFGGPSYVARVAPLELKVSQEVRLKRLVRGAVYKPDRGQVQLPVTTGGSQLIQGVIALLRQLLPPQDTDVASADTVPAGSAAGSSSRRSRAGAR
jgi:transcription-repair coupling factor (superfamily II helicase)